MPITAGNSAFTWSLAPETLGTISNNGYFTGTSGSATGNIVVSYKSYSLEIPVEVGRPPKMISTFEDVVIGKDWIMHIENPGNGAIGSVSINH